MFLQLNHHKFDVYRIARSFVKECYSLPKTFPPDEKYAMVQQINRAAVTPYINLAEGFSRKSEVERKRFFEVSRGSIIEIDAALDVAEDMAYCKREDLIELGKCPIRTFSMLPKLISH